MERNILTYIKNNYCCMYDCWEIEKELAEIIKKTNAERYFIFKELVEHFGRVLEEDDICFKGELGRETHWKLLKEIENNLLVKSYSCKKYPGSTDIWLTFVVFR